jgi:hypothetical protein
MSGAEVLGIVSGILAVLDAASKFKSAVQSSSGLPSAFLDVAKRLPLVRTTLESAEEQLRGGAVDEAECDAMKPILEGCMKKTETLEKIFRSVVSVGGSARRPERYPKLERWATAVRAMGKGPQVEVLMKGILEDIQVLTANHSIKYTMSQRSSEPGESTPMLLPTSTSTSDSYSRSQRSSEQAESTPILSPIPEPIQEPLPSSTLILDSDSFQYFNFGPSLQNIQTGGGVQNNNNGTGYQVIGTIGGALIFQQAVVVSK